MHYKRYFHAFCRLVVPLMMIAWALPAMAQNRIHPEIRNEPQSASQSNLSQNISSVKDPGDYANIIYIDPSTTTPGDGSSPDMPLQSWSQVSFQTDTAYLQKRGTSDTITSAIIVSPDSVLLGAYGSESDPHPVIFDGSTTIKYMIQVAGSAVTVRDLEIVSPRATSGIHFAAGYWPTDGVAYNNYIHGVDQSNYLMWGIRVFGERTRVLSNTIEYIGDDGIFVQYFPDVEIAYNQIAHVNQKWFENPSESYSGGDGIQYDSSDRFYIHHNFIDRSDTGNKFCIIVDPKVDQAEGGLIENNDCRLHASMAGIFAGGAKPYAITIRNNRFEYPYTDHKSIAIYSHSVQPDIYNNVFIGMDQAINLWNTAAQAKVHHNTFYDIGSTAIRGSVSSIEAHNNLFAIPETTAAFGLDSLTASNNLFLYASQSTGSNPVIGDPAFVDAANHDFHLSPESDAVDAGTLAPNIGTDFDGNQRDASPDIGAYELQPALILRGTPGDRTINLDWDVNLTLPVTTSWTIIYTGPLGDEPSPISGITGTLRTYALTGLTNYEWYEITLTTDPPMLTDTISLMPTDITVYLPLLQRQADEPAFRH